MLWRAALSLPTRILVFALVVNSSMESSTNANHESSSGIEYERETTIRVGHTALGSGPLNGLLPYTLNAAYHFTSLDSQDESIRRLGTTLNLVDGRLHERIINQASPNQTIRRRYMTELALASMPHSGSQFIHRMQAPPLPNSTAWIGSEAVIIGADGASVIELPRFSFHEFPQGASVRFHATPFTTVICIDPPLPLSSSTARMFQGGRTPFLPNVVMQTNRVLHENRNTPYTRPISWGETFLGLTFQAALALIAFRSQSSSSQSVSLALHFVGLCITIGFAGCLIGILFRSVHTAIASVIERIGSVSAALAFFVMMGLFEPEDLKWIVGLACIGSFLACLVAFFKRK